MSGFEEKRGIWKNPEWYIESLIEQGKSEERWTQTQIINYEQYLEGWT